MAKVKFDFNPFKTVGIQLRGEERTSALNEIKDFLLDQILVDVGNQKSSVSGSRWPSLSRLYKKEKGKVASPIANLELTGKMLDNLKVVKRDSNLRIEVRGSLNMKKADNHNHLRKFGSPTLPKRQFMPNENKPSEVSTPFRPGIMREITKIIKEHKE